MVVYAVGATGFNPLFAYDEGWGTKLTDKQDEVIDIFIRNQHGLWIGSDLSFFLLKGVLRGMDLARIWNHIVVDKKDGYDYSGLMKGNGTDFVSVSPEELGGKSIGWSDEPIRVVESIKESLDESVIVKRLEFLHENRLALNDVRYDPRQLMSIRTKLWR